MLLLGIDIETTGTDKDCKIIEVGAVLWDTEQRAPVSMISELIEPTAEEAFEPGIPVPGLDPQTIRKIGHPLRFWLDRYFINTWAKCQYMVAHNAAFEREHLPMDFTKQRPWIDTMLDIDYPDWMRGRSLADLAYNHGLHNPYPHRALFDALVMMQLLDRYDLETILGNATTPKVEIFAHQSREDNEKAKALGFRWIENRWRQTVRLNQVLGLRKKAGFPMTDSRGQAL